jgi:TPP-dependent indolepyruvate ferredoxin oxidoreductase alpha subunit
MKRAKTSSDQETTNVQARVESGRYNTLQEFLADIEKASAAVIERNQNQSNGTKADGTPLTEVVNRIAAFKKHMNSLVGQSFVNQTEVKAEASEDEAEQSAEALASIPGAREDRQALTFFGSNPSSQTNPKQLFSSLQKAVKVPLQSSESDVEKFVEVQEQLRETALPAGIISTRWCLTISMSQSHKRGPLAKFLLPAQACHTCSLRAREVTEALQPPGLIRLMLSSIQKTSWAIAIATA